jgi:ATP-binding cassette subfamily C (CFTR/MRP) protein 4
MLASSATGANVGLVITSAILLETGYQWAIRQLTEVDTQMTCVSRVDEYAHIPPEKGYINTENPPPSNWPDCGSITFQKACLAYNEANTVLHDLTFVVKPKEKIGIVGRTGAGKSSIINALFRLIELTEGSIIIDGIDINSVGLHDLRKKISIIPQEPVLFSATIRKNLDPFDQKPDGKIWRALDQVMLRETVQDIPKGLEAFTSEEMNHFSLGQRQLLCLARAILQKNNILILDEATANVDPKTDETIQKTIRTAFKDSTVITIAHRLDTVIDNDRILVLESGRLAEFDTPHNLLSNEESIFSNMVRATGWDNAKKLMMAARRTADAKDKLERMASNQSSIIDNNYASEISVTSNSSII